MSYRNFFYLIIISLKLITSDSPKVTTKYGDIIGSYDKTTGNRVFLGIPYAKPPVGDLRFKPPQQPQIWAPNPRNALEFAPSCIQNVDLSIEFPVNQSEDCLYLNVWTPASITEPLTVMVWIHGGSFVAGSSTEFTYNGNNLSKQGNVVVVTLNYRLGILGFLSSDLIAKEDTNWGTSGNYGLLDQNLALQWVRDNISAFGGNPDNITLFGESAGSFSVCYHLLMPKSKGLFKRAILQSGSCAIPLFAIGKTTNYFLPNINPVTYLETSANYIRELSCSDIICLRSLKDSTIKDYQFKKSEFRVGPYVDGIVIPDDPIKLFQKGDYNKVDIIFGTTLNEGTMFSKEQTYEEFSKIVEFLFPIHSDKVISLYPNSKYNTGFAAFSQMYTDFIFLCPGRNLLKLVGGNTYQYLFSHKPSFISNKYNYLDVFHGSELFFMFNNPLINFVNDNNKPFTQDEINLSNQMIDFWSSFAKSGNPSSNLTSSNWPKFSKDDQSYLILDVKELKQSKNLSQLACDVYDLTVSPTTSGFMIRPFLILYFLLLFI